MLTSTSFPRFEMCPQGHWKAFTQRTGPGLSNFGLLFGPLSEFTSTLGKTANVNAFNAIVCDQCWQHCYTQCFSVAFHSSKIVCCKFLFRPWCLSLSLSRAWIQSLRSVAGQNDLKHVILLTFATRDPTSVKHHCLIAFLLPLVPVWGHLACFARETSKSCESGLDPLVHFRSFPPRGHELYPGALKCRHMMNGILALTEDQTVSLLWGLSGPQSHSVFSRVTMLLLLLLLP